jgi:acyl-coenzyme A thioesterase PaaI-like protein
MTTLTHTVQAFNTAVASENKIHDDTVAARFGFTGGLVPGVEVFAYATHVPLVHYGPAWLEAGRMEMRFVKPVYDGRQATVTGVVDASALKLSVASDGTHCAEGDASLARPANVVAAPHREPLAAHNRLPADETSLAVGTLLSTRPKLITADVLHDYLTAVRETTPLYRETSIIHPGQMLRACNSVLMENVVLPPWIHVGSKAHFLSIGRVGESIAARARVIANYDRKGHRLVDLDVVVLADGVRPLAHVVHTAIYRLRG